MSLPTTRREWGVSNLECQVLHSIIFIDEAENDAIQNLANGSVGFESDKATGRILGAGIY